MSNQSPDSVIGASIADEHRERWNSVSRQMVQLRPTWSRSSCDQINGQAELRTRPVTLVFHPSVLIILHPISLQADIRSSVHISVRFVPTDRKRRRQLRYPAPFCPYHVRTRSWPSSDAPSSAFGAAHPKKHIEVEAYTLPVAHHIAPRYRPSRRLQLRLRLQTSRICHGLLQRPAAAGQAFAGQLPANTE